MSVIQILFVVIAALGLAAALGTVLDPELDEPITTLDFVASCNVSGDGVASVHLRLPTFFCAPNFSFLMVADAYDAVSAVERVTRAEIVLDDHHASAEINDGVAAHAGFVQTFAGEADYSFSHFFIVTQHLWHCGFRPDQQVRLVGQCLLGEFNELVEPQLISVLIPNDGLGNAWLHKRNVQRSSR